ncbi:threonine dehydrogenase [Colletotrichum plurivorum]|uniref:Threonine dehydrogenase n=1 Tax=Colletotrichum plurivorum TaxID=2175906 RepID=A0A8H6JTK7_9PEZI|nr:threonine dehydrogenase [Colletotrichum plurivorum]
MKSVQVTGPGVISWVDIPRPKAGPKDVLLKMKACGTCGSDALYTDLGGIPPLKGRQPLGHEPAAEVITVGEAIAEPDIDVGDDVVIDTLVFSDGALGSGGSQGALSEYVVVRDYEPRKQLSKIPAHVSWHVAALNEPMAVALHTINRTNPKPGCKVVIFGAGAVGLGCVLAYRRRGAAHIIVVDVVGSRLEKAKRVGADVAIDSTGLEDAELARSLMDLHGDGATGWNPGLKAGTDIYVDAAGAPPVPRQVAAIAKQGATFAVVGVHKKPVELPFGDLITKELSIVFCLGYPTEIFEVTDDIAENWETYGEIVSDQVPFERAPEALALARSGKADKVVVMFD